MERSFKKEVQALKLGDGETFRGEGILAVTKALLQSGVSYVGGYQGAPVSHLLDVLVDAEDIIADLGVHLETCTNEASAAAMLGASINYPLRGAVTWKSIVGTNVAADALSNLASPGVIGGAMIILGEDYGEGASVIQERSYAYAHEIVDVAARSAPRPAHHRAHGREGLRAVGGEPRAGHDGAAHPRLPRHRRVHRPRTTARGAFSGNNRIAGPPRFEYGAAGASAGASSSQERLKVEERLPAAQRLHPRAQAQRGDRRRPRRHRHHRAGRAHQQRAARAGAARSRRPLRRDAACRSTCSTSSIRWCRRRCASSAPASARCWWSRKARPTTSSRQINVELRRADIQTRVLGKGALPQAGEYTSDVLLNGLARLPRARRGRPASMPTRSSARAKRMLAHKAGRGRGVGDIAGAAADLLHRLPGAAGVHRHQADAARARADPYQRRHRLPFVRDLRAVQPGQLDPRLRHVARERRRGRRPIIDTPPDRDHGRRRLLAQRPDHRRRRRTCSTRATAC